MDTRWRRFRYGTETRNPSWSFFASVLCPACMLICLALDYWRANGFWIVTAAWFLVFSVISLVHLGRLMKNEKGNLLSVGLLDRAWPDLILFLLLTILFFFLFVLDWHGNSGWWSYCHAVNRAFRYFWQPIIFLCDFAAIFFSTGTMVFFFVVLYMAVIRQGFREKLRKKLFFPQVYGRLEKKGRRLWKRWEENRILRAERGNAAKIFRRRQLLLLCGQGVFLFFTGLYVGAAYGAEDLMALLLPVGAACFLADLMFVISSSRAVGVLLDEIRHITEEEWEWEGPVLKPHSVFRQSEERLLSIRENQRESMEKRLQSERTKVDLITNVSHDLKTPLTSMIGCIDLLKQVEELPEEAQDYVELLSKKAERLRGMIQDVFDMAKATGGGQDLCMERLDMGRLIRQTAADMQDRIDASGLVWRMRIEDGELPFWGDSRKMYRVYQNLMENALKYSMAGSRVYVEVEEQDGVIRTSVKNISQCEMDFSAEEIMERFTRGDKSRSTEGNGLGLAIAKSFTEACGGKFEVTLDGDLFRADTEFKKI